MKKNMLIMSLLIVGGLQAKPNRDGYFDSMKHQSGSNDQYALDRPPRPADQYTQLMKASSLAEVKDADQYTPLMKASSLAETKELVKNGADVNEAIWQYDWGHYVTALDCANYAYRLNSTVDNLARVNFLMSRGVNAKTAVQLGLGSFKGAVVPSK